MPSEGWAFELCGDPIDLGDAQHDLKRPFDPWVEPFTVGGREVLLLRTAAWDGMETTTVLMEHAQALLSRLNGAKLVLYNDSRPLSLGAVHRFDADGHRIPVTLDASAHAALGEIRMRARASLSRIGEPPQPKRSPLQDHLLRASGDTRVADMLMFIARADNWFDLYKAIELLQKLAGKRTLEHRFGGWSRVRQTANSHRHAPGTKNESHASPATFGEARTLILHAAREILQTAVPPPVK